MLKPRSDNNNDAGSTMKHIFYLHSNICVIAAFDTIKELVEDGENVVVVSNRRTAFPFFRGRISFFDIQEITDKYRLNTNNVVKKLINYKYKYLPHFTESANTIIGNEDFILYTPSYNLFIIRPYLKSPYLKGYYFIEEGTMTYNTEDFLRKRYYFNRYHRGRILSDLFGVGETLDYKTTKKFKGCIALSNFAFPWCKENKTINGTSNYMSLIDTPPVSADCFIVTGYLQEETKDVMEGISKIMTHIYENGNPNSIAFKFHPTAFSYEKEKVEAIQQYIAKEYPKLNVIYMPAKYSVESTLFTSNTIMYSIFGISSLSLYSLLFGSKSYYVPNASNAIVKEIPTVDDFLHLTNC